LQLIVENQAGIPLLMKSISVLSSDKTGFRETIQTHIKQLTEAHPLKYIIGDSALYTASSKRRVRPTHLFQKRIASYIIRTHQKRCVGWDAPWGGEKDTKKIDFLISKKYYFYSK